MSHAYQRAMKNVPEMLRSGQIEHGIEELARATASTASSSVLSNLPRGADAATIERLIDESTDAPMYFALMLGWAAAHSGLDPAEFSVKQTDRFGRIYRDQIAADIEHVLEGRELAPTESSIREFFCKSELMEYFHNEHCAGVGPWSAVIDASESLIVSDASRSVFYRVARENGDFKTTLFNDAMALLDPESEEALEVGRADTADKAFSLVLSHAELSPAPAPGV